MCLESIYSPTFLLTSNSVPSAWQTGHQVVRQGRQDHASCHEGKPEEGGRVQRFLRTYFACVYESRRLASIYSRNVHMH